MRALNSGTADSAFTSLAAQKSCGPRHVTSGAMPKRSRATTSSPRSASQSANAKNPRSRSTTSSPHAR
jgi:hypothetical protein